MREMDNQVELWVSTVGSDPEASLLHAEIYAALNAAGLKVKGYTGYRRAIGLTINQPSGPQYELLVRLFAEIGLSLDYEPGGIMGKTIPEIIVGTKLPMN
jgi:hypothetical protein